MIVSFLAEQLCLLNNHQFSRRYADSVMNRPKAQPGNLQETLPAAPVQILIHGASFWKEHSNLKQRNESSRLSLMRSIMTKSWNSKLVRLVDRKQTHTSQLQKKWKLGPACWLGRCKLPSGRCKLSCRRNPPASRNKIWIGDKVDLRRNYQRVRSYCLKRICFVSVRVGAHRKKIVTIQPLLYNLQH